MKAFLDAGKTEQARVDTAQTAYRETQGPGSYDVPRSLRADDDPDTTVDWRGSPQWVTDAVASVSDVLPDSRVVVEVRGTSP